MNQELIKRFDEWKGPFETACLLNDLYMVIAKLENEPTYKIRQDQAEQITTLTRHLDEANTEIRRLKALMGRPSSGWRMPSEGGK